MVTRSLVKKQHATKSGLPPGTLVHVGHRKVPHPQLTLFTYNENSFTESTLEKLDELNWKENDHRVYWLNLNGLHDTDVVKKIGEIFSIHTLTLEDILNTNQRTKTEDQDTYCYTVLQMLSCLDKRCVVTHEQVSIILGSNFVITFQERSGDVFDLIRDRIRKKAGKLRSKGPDYLAYSLIDAIVDSYYHVIENLGDKIESIEEHLLSESTKVELIQIHELKRELLLLKKSIWPLRDVVNNLLREDTKFFQRENQIYLKDLYDHVVHIIEIVETFREILMSLVDLHMSQVSNKMNQVMKVLTIIATIFIPITFVVGVYGMNFDFMPELHWKWAYPAVWILMIAMTGSMFVFFKRKKWL